MRSSKRRPRRCPECRAGRPCPLPTPCEGPAGRYAFATSGRICDLADLPEPRRSRMLAVDAIVRLGRLPGRWSEGRVLAVPVESFALLGSVSTDAGRFPIHVAARAELARREALDA